MTHRRSRRLALAAALLLPFVHAPVGAQDRESGAMVIAIGDEGESTKLIVTELRQRFPAAIVSSAERVGFKKRPAVLIAVGPAALRTLLDQRLDTPIVSIFTASHTYREILIAAGLLESKTVTAIFPEPSPSEQLDLITAIYRKRITVGVLASEKTAHLLPELKLAAARSNIELQIESPNPGESINQQLNRVANAAVLLALPDPTIFSPENIRNILMTTYRREQAVLGFSAAFVRAGALAANVSSIQHITAQLEELLAEFDTTGKLPQAQFPRYFDVVINESVARSLNLVIDESIKQRSRNPRGRVKP